MNFNIYLIPGIKSNSKLIIYLNIKHRTIKLFEENICNNRLDKGCLGKIAKAH